MAWKNLNLRAVVSPTPIVIAAAYDENGKADACTLAFFAPISHVPPCVVIGINATQKRKTLKSILASGAFTIGYPCTDQATEADYLGVESGYDADKLANVGFTVTEAQTVHAPIIDQMKLTLECKVVHTVTIGTHMQITGEVTNILADEAILDGKDHIALKNLQPIIYDKEGLSYHSLGNRVADAFRTGAEFKKALAHKDTE